MRKVLCLFVMASAALVWSAGAAAQTKFSGTCTCKLDQQHVLPVGDRPEHSLGVEQLKCEWSKPMDFNGDKSKDGIATHTLDANGAKERFRGVHMITMQSGDKVALPYQGSGENHKDTKEAHSKGTFTITDGTGKLKGISGKGTFSCAGKGDDPFTCTVEGEYQSLK